ncbi:PleD family two-component system response regulator [Paraburkholderia sp. BR13444]|uniref:PleD family two-component system response regulator n=1 Tax=Paraburkholderia sp. BR13444 TaxID=3236997 RepID=UPI0034D00712
MSTILLVDDDPEARWALQLALEADGHHVVLAVNGQDALQKAALQHPQLVITDWNMVEMDGIELCCRLRCRPALSDIPIILLSAMEEPEMAPRHWSAFLRKPVSLEALLSAVNLFIARRLSVRHLPRSGEQALPFRWRAVDSRCWP